MYPIFSFLPYHFHFCFFPVRWSPFLIFRSVYSILTIIFHQTRLSRSSYMIVSLLQTAPKLTWDLHFFVFDNYLCIALHASAYEVVGHQWPSTRHRRYTILYQVVLLVNEFSTRCTLWWSCNLLAPVLKDLASLERGSEVINDNQANEGYYVIMLDKRICSHHVGIIVYEDRLS